MGAFLPDTAKAILLGLIAMPWW